MADTTLQPEDIVGLTPGQSQFFYFPDDGLSSGEQIYDYIMNGIEPDLVSSAVGTLEEKYKNETPEQKEQRKERYDNAYAEYEKRYKQYRDTREQAMRLHKNKVMKSFEEEDREHDANGMQSIEQQISSI